MDQIVIAEIALIWVTERSHFQSSQNPQLKHICSHDLGLAPRYLAREPAGVRRSYCVCGIFRDLAFVIFNHHRLKAQAYL